MTGGVCGSEAPVTCGSRIHTKLYHEVADGRRTRVRASVGRLLRGSGGPSMTPVEDELTLTST
jgi:hypothetical protein